MESNYKICTNCGSLAVWNSYFQKYVCSICGNYYKKPNRIKMYLPFGDWSKDGHGLWTQILIEAPSMKCLLEAQTKIRNKYGSNFFESFANQHNDSHLGDKVWLALVETHYPISRLSEIEKISYWHKFCNLDEVLDRPDIPEISIYGIEDMFIWLLNFFGADIIKCEEEIPMICNWTCPGFQTVGYGAFIE